MQRRLGAGFAVLAFVTWLLLIFGSTVRVHGAGLSCPDWPLCFGQLVPQLDMRVFLEWGHRVLAGTISLGFLGLGGAVLAHAELRRRFWAQLLLMVGVLLCQIVLGGVTVLAGLAYWSVTLHLLFGNLFMALMIVMAARLRGWGRGESASPRLRSVGVATVVAVAAQLALGGLVSSNYAGLACTEWPSCLPGVWFPSFAGPIGLQVMHRLGGYAVASVAVLLAVVARSTAFARLGGLVLGLVLLQIVLGVLNVVALMPVELAVAHAATAHAIVASTTLLVTGVFGRGRAPVPA